MKNAITKKHVRETLKAAGVHVSAGNMKIGNTANFSLAPVRTCSALARKTCANGKCYALKSYNCYPDTRRAWDDNTHAALHDLETLESCLNLFIDVFKPDFFRIHVAGDFVTVDYGRMWYRIAERHPGTAFLAFSKQFSVVRLVPFHTLDNFSLRLSDWPGIDIPDDLRKLYHVAWLNDGTRPASTFPANAIICPGNCETCGACWDADCDTIFNIHGVPIDDAQRDLMNAAIAELKAARKR